MSIGLFPNNLIYKVLLSEYLIHQNLDIVSDMIVKVYVDAGGIAHDGLDGTEVFVHPVQVALLVPDVTIHLLLEGTQLVAVQFALGLVDSLCHSWIAAHIDLLGIVGSAGKGRVDIHQVHLDVVLLQISTGGETLASHHQVVTLAVAFFQFHLVERHAAADALIHLVGITIAQHSAGAHKVVEHGLPFKGANGIGYVFYSHISVSRY